MASSEPLHETEIPIEEKNTSSSEVIFNLFIVERIKVFLKQTFSTQS